MYLLPFKKLLLGIAISSLLFTACKKKEEESSTPLLYENGVFVINEGPYGSGAGSISFIDHANNGIYNNIFENKNGFPLGNIVQSFNIIGNNGYVVVNNANKIEIVDQKSFTSVGSISGLESPRNICAVNATKAYVSQWGSDGMTGAIKVIDLGNKSITKTIAVGSGAGNMQLIGDKIYVACSGGFASDSSVYVINTITDAVDQILKVGANPNYIIKTDNQTLFVLCSGRWTSDYKSLEAYGSLVKINTADNSFTKLFELSDLNNSQPNSLTSNGSNLYFNFGGTVYQQSITGSTFENNSFITRNFYGLGVDPISNKLYAADAGNFSNAGKVLRYDLTGNVIDSFNVAVAPNGFYFNTK